MAQQKGSMKIKQIIITPDELKEAVQNWLELRGLAIDVKDIEEVGYPVKGYELETELRERPPQRITPDPVEATIQAMHNAAEGAAVFEQVKAWEKQVKDHPPAAVPLPAKPSAGEDCAGQQAQGQAYPDPLDGRGAA